MKTYKCLLAKDFKGWRKKLINEYLIQHEVTKIAVIPFLNWSDKVINNDLDYETLMYELEDVDFIIV